MAWEGGHYGEGGVFFFSQEYNNVYCAKFMLSLAYNGHPIINIICCDVVSSCLSNACVAQQNKILLFNMWTQSLRYVLSEFQKKLSQKSAVFKILNELKKMLRLTIDSLYRSNFFTFRQSLNKLAVVERLF